MNWLLITGGSRGIGAAVARLGAARGYAVAINYLHNQSAAHQLVTEIESQGGRATALAFDVGQEEEVMRLFAEVDRLGPLDALVNNAGILETQTHLLGIDQARLQKVFATNVFGPILCCREAVRRMSTQAGGAGGAIVNISSIASRLGAPNEYIDYAASKGAIDSLTIGLSKEVANQGVRVNAVRPGLIHTEIHASGGEPGRVDRLASSIPMGRGGQAEEVATAVLWLLSAEASYVNGAILDVSGGR